MAHLQHMDEMVKEYLSYRGFTSTLRTLDNELKSDKDKGFRADKITDQVLNYIHTYDLSGLRELWQHLDKHIFNRLSLNLQPCVKKLEACILKLYVVNMIQTNKQDKLTEFFEKMASELQNLPEWRDWFVLPYLKNVDENTMFAMYFTRQWQDTFLVSLQNFLSIVFQHMTLPTLASYADESKKVNQIQEENELLKMRLAALTSSDQTSLDQIPVPDPTPPWHLMDDFYSIAQETPTSDSSLKSLKNILFGLGGGFSAAPTQPTQRGQNAASHPRRTSSQAPPEERRRPRSSSVAPPTSQASDHAPVKRLSQGAHVSRSASKPLHLETDTAQAGDDLCPFILLSQDYYKDHRAIVSHTLFNSSGSLIASADTDGVVKVWSPSPSPRTDSSIVVKGSVTGLQWFPTHEQLIIIGTKNGSLRLYDSQEKKTVWAVKSDTYSQLKDVRLMTLCVTSSENKFLLSTTANGSTSGVVPAVHVFDIKSQTLESSYQVDGSAVNMVTLNHNGSLMICGCSDGYIRILDTRLGDVVDAWSAHQGQVLTVKLNSGEDKLYSIGSDNKIAVWNLIQTASRIFEQSLTDKATGPFLFDDSALNGSSVLRPYGPLFALHQNNTHLFAGSSSGPIIYKIGNSELRPQMQLLGHNKSVITLDWSSAVECGTCVAASLDGKVSITTLLSQ